MFSELIEMNMISVKRGIDIIRNDHMLWLNKNFSCYRDKSCYPRSFMCTIDFCGRYWSAMVVCSNAPSFKNICLVHQYLCQFEEVVIISCDVWIRLLILYKCWCSIVFIKPKEFSIFCTPCFCTLCFVYEKFAVLWSPLTYRQDLPGHRAVLETE